MEKRYGATEAQNRLMQIGRSQWALFYGYGTDGDNGYNYYKTYDYKPTLSEVKSDIIAQINANTDEIILSGFSWEGKLVWLSKENQINYQAVVNIAGTSAGLNLPVTFKFGTDDEPQYHTFELLDDLYKFHTAMWNHITQAIAAGWAEKDAIDWSVYDVQ